MQIDIVTRTVDAYYFSCNKFKGAFWSLRIRQYVNLPILVSRKESAVKKNIDALINDLKSEPLNRDLSSLEAEVWERIDARNSTGFVGTPAAVTTNGRFFATPAVSRTAAVALAIAIGLVVGLFGAPAPSSSGDLSVFSVDAPYAPSGILG